MLPGAWVASKGLPECQDWSHSKGLRPLPPTPADSRIFGFFDLGKNVDFENFPVGLGVQEVLQSIGNGCVLQMIGLSAHFEPSGSTSDDFHDFGHFGVDSRGLTLFSKGPRTVKVPGRTA